MRPLTAGERMQSRWADGRRTVDVVAGFIKPNDRLTSFDRLEIYNRQYWFRLLDCLREDYPGLRAVLGDTRFHRLAVAYLTRHPSTSPVLRDLGGRLVQFIGAEPAWTFPHGDKALDMARLEWAQVVAFDGGARRAATLKKLAGTPPDRIHLRLQPHITLLELSYPMDGVILRLLRQQDDRLRGEASNAIESSDRPRQRSIAHRIKPAATHLLVHRQENSVYFKRLTAPQFKILRALDSGASLAVALEKLPASVSPQDIQSWFQTWASLGFLVPAAVS